MQPTGAAGPGPAELACCASPTAATRRMISRVSPLQASAACAPRPRSNSHRSRRSCSIGPTPAPAPAPPTSPAHPTPVPPPRRAAARADSRPHQRTRPPTIRSSKRAAQPNSSSTCRRDARTSTAANSTSSPSIATAVCDPLCGSTPIITVIPSVLPDRHARGPRWALLIPEDRRCSHLFRATPQ